MTKLTFITGNQHKADQLARFLAMPIAHHKLDLDEIQSLDLHVIVEHKVRQAFDILRKPVLVEDSSLEFTALGRLPGPFIKFFTEELPLKTICSLIKGTDRSATGRTLYGYFDGTTITYVEGILTGTITDSPLGEGGYGWDSIFIPDGYQKTRAQMSNAEYEATFNQLKAADKLKVALGF